MDRNVNDNFKFNQETEFVPILGLVASRLSDSKQKESNGDDAEAAPVQSDGKASSIQINHHSSLLSLIAGELSVAPEQLHDFELYVLLDRPFFASINHTSLPIPVHYTIPSPLF